MPPGFPSSGKLFCRPTGSESYISGLLTTKLQPIAPSWADLSLCRHRHPSRHLGFHQVQQSRQVVGRKRKQRLSGQLRQPFMFGLAQSAHGLDPAKSLFDHLAASDAHGVALPPCGTAVHRTAAGLAGDVRFQIPLFEQINKFCCVIPLVRANRGSRFTHAAFDHGVRRLPLCATVGLRRFHIDHQAMPVFGQGVRHVSELGFGVLALLVEPGLRVSTAFVGDVAALLAFEVDLGIASGRAVWPALPSFFTKLL